MLVVHIDVRARNQQVRSLDSRHYYVMNPHNMVECGMVDQKLEEGT